MTDLGLVTKNVTNLSTGKVWPRWATVLKWTFLCFESKVCGK